MSKCLACGADLPPRTEGKRERKFCDNKNKCKQLYHSKNQKEKKFKTIPIEQWEEIQKKLAAGSEVKKEIKITDATKQTNKVEPVKPLGSDKSNFTINTEKSTGLTPYQEMLKKKRGF